jgi:hypothetical protein
MDTSSNISASGQIKNTLHMGFTLLDALKELLDNSHDAHATRCRVRISSSSKIIYIDDDGNGMSESTLHSATRFHNTREASSANGCRGFGLNAAHIRISGASAPTRIFTRVAGGNVIETALNWSQYLQNDLYNPQVNDLTVARQSEWEHGAINRDHGTVTMIPMTDSLFSEMEKDLANILNEIGRTYEKHIRNGFRITFVLDDREYIPDFSRALNWEDTPVTMRNEVRIELWVHPETKEERLYFWHKHGKPEWEDMVRKDPVDNKKFLRDLPFTEAGGFAKVGGEIKLRSTYNPQWNPPQPAVGNRPPNEPGYLSFCRNGRHLRAVKNEYPSTGDYEKRRVIATTRSALVFTHECDPFINISVNKSQIIVDNVHQGILKLAHELAKNWAGRLYDRNFKPPKEVGPEDVQARHLKNAVRMLKANARVLKDDWYDDFLQWLEDNTDDVLVDDAQSMNSISP